MNLFIQLSKFDCPPSGLQEQSRGHHQVPHPAVAISLNCDEITTNRRPPILALQELVLASTLLLPLLLVLDCGETLGSITSTKQ